MIFMLVWNSEISEEKSEIGKKKTYCRRFSWYYRSFIEISSNVYLLQKGYLASSFVKLNWIGFCSAGEVAVKVDCQTYHKDLQDRHDDRLDQHEDHLDHLPHDQPARLKCSGLSEARFSSSLFKIRDIQKAFA